MVKKRVKALVLGENEKLCEKIRQVLQGIAGIEYILSSSEDTKYARSIIESKINDVVIIEESFGLSNFDKIKSIIIDNNRVPFIVISADLRAEGEAWMRVGATDFLQEEALTQGLLDRALRLSIEINKNEALITSQQINVSSSLRLSALARISSEVIHEINNPLAVILGQASIMNRVIKSGNLKVDMITNGTEKVMRMGTRITTIVDRLRGYIRKSADHTFERVMLSELLDEIPDLCHRRLQKARAELVVGDIPEELAIDCSPIEISQVIVNLVNNACDAIAPLARRKIEINVKQDKGNAVISIADSGNKIPAEIADKIFQPFFTSKKAKGGSGLGLSLSRDIVVLHRGTLTLDRESENTNFLIILPRVHEIDEKEKVTVLLVDDEPDILYILEEELSERSCVVLQASDGEKAFELIQRNSIDIVISDLKMPSCDGEELYKRIQSEIKKPPMFVFITGNPDMSEDDLENIGASHLFHKPFNSRELVEKVLATFLEESKKAA